MATGEVLGELIARVLVARDDPVHDAHRLQDHEVPVHRALCELVAALEDLGDRERADSGRESIDECGAVGRHTLVRPTQALGHGRLHVHGRHAAECRTLVRARR